MGVVENIKEFSEFVKKYTGILPPDYALGLHKTAA